MEIEWHEFCYAVSIAVVHDCNRVYIPFKSGCSEWWLGSPVHCVLLHLSSCSTACAFVYTAAVVGHCWNGAVQKCPCHQVLQECRW